MYEIFKLYQLKYDKNNWSQAGQSLMENIGNFIVFNMQWAIYSGYGVGGS